MASYSNLLFAILTWLLAYESIQSGFVVQGLSVVLLWLSLRSDPSMSTLLLVPLVLLSERCLQTRMSLGHSPLAFYASALFAYINAFQSPSRTSRGDICRPRVPPTAVTSSQQRGNSSSSLQWHAAGFAAGSLLYVLTGEYSLGFAIAVYVSVGSEVFLLTSPSSVGGQGFQPREAHIVASLCGFICLDAVVNNNLKIVSPDGTDSPSSSVIGQLKAVQITSYPHIAGRNALIASLVIAVGSALLVKRLGDDRAHRWLRSGMFIVTALASVGLAYGFTFHLFEEEPVLWLWAYLNSKKMRLYALLLWFTGIPLATLAIAIFGTSVRINIRRKLYHFLAVACFLPVAILDPSFLGFCVAIATSLAVIVESARAVNVTGTGWLRRFMDSQIDARDEGGIVRTHIYLILGFGLSLFLRYRSELLLSRPIPLPIQLIADIIPGIVTLGIVDSFAAIGGTLFKATKGTGSGAAAVAAAAGKRTTTTSKSTALLSAWFCNRFFPEKDNVAFTHKTWHGVASGIAAGCMFWGVLCLVLQIPMISSWCGMGFALVVAAGVSEAVCDGIDNLELPLIVYACASAGAATMMKR